MFEWLTQWIRRRQVEAAFRRANDGFIDEERRQLYRTLTWRVTEVALEDLGVWHQAQGLPGDWCRGSVVDTAAHLVGEVWDGEYGKKLRYLLAQPEFDAIIVVDGRLRRGREACDSVLWSIDDGCMRALASALRGATHIACYAGAAGIE